MTTAGQKYFVSYARGDSEFVLRLAKELRNAGANIWVDQLDVIGGQRWDEAVENALHTCESMVIILSPDSVTSNNVMDEVSYALEEQKLIVPVLYQDCDTPFRLRRFQYVNFVGDYDRGFGDLLRALGIEQTSHPQEVAAHEEPVMTAPPPTSAPLRIEQTAPQRTTQQRSIWARWSAIIGVFIAFLAVGWGVAELIFQATDREPAPAVGAMGLILGIGITMTYLMWKHFR